MNRHCLIFLFSIFSNIVLSFENPKISLSVKKNIIDMKLVRGDSLLSLPNRFIIDGSVKIKFLSGDSIPFKVESLKGDLLFTKSPVDTVFLNIEYDYLEGSLPTFLDSGIETLPKIDLKKINGIKKSTISKSKRTKEILPVVADGFFSRSIGFSQNTGAQINGGLQLNLQGKLSEDMTISGVLSDQNIPIQPEGDTHSLNEIDKVFIEVNHPLGFIKAGDIDISLRNGRYQRHDRRLEGVNLSSNYNNSNFGFTIGSARGKYSETEFRGEDQNQGPYQLTSSDGSRRIIVTAGSEIVWLNGKKLMRGESADYTIDYSQSEIMFTPVNLIDSNSRIYVEYEYSDFGFQRQVYVGSASRQFINKKGSISINYIREADNTSNESFYPITSQDRLIMESAGKGGVKKSLAFPDSLGKYKLDYNSNNLSDSIFIYIDDLDFYDGKRYTVGFNNAGNLGQYARRVTEKSELYFEYIQPSERNNYTDLYVPWKLISSPQVQQVANLMGTLPINDETFFSFEIAGSGFNPNRFSSIQNQTGGLAGELAFSHKAYLPRSLGELSFRAESRGAGDGFKAIQRESQVEFSREWNLQRDIWESSGRNDLSHDLSQITLSHEINRKSSTSISIGKYEDKKQKSYRRHLKSSFNNIFFNSISLDLSDVNRKSQIEPSLDSHWKRDRFFASLFKGSFHPYLRFQKEKRTYDMKFDEKGAGIQLENKRINGKLGIINRNDYSGNLEFNNWRNEGESWLGEIDILARPIKSLTTKLILKQRLKSFKDDREDLNYRLARGSIRYTPKRGNTKASFDFKLERSLYEEKIVVYDSISYGPGQFRYDNETGLYIEDPAGHYISFHIPSGNRLPSTRFVSGLRLTRHLRNFSNSFLKDVTFRLIGSTDFNGENPTYNSIFSPSINQTGLNRSQFNSQVEVRYAPGKKLRRIILKGLTNREVVSQSIQELRDRIRKLISIKWEEPLNEHYRLVFDLSKSGFNHISSIKLRERRTNGMYSETGLKWRKNQSLQLGGNVIIGKDIGNSFLGIYNVDIKGTEFDALIFPGLFGRINTTLTIVKVKQNNTNIKVLPPEAAKGMQTGINIKGSINALINLTESLVLNLNTTYQHDSIHSNFLIFNGELRASF